VSKALAESRYGDHASHMETWDQVRNRQSKTPQV
jgi:hypothetical protein